jgi:hypothetical protein
MFERFGDDARRVVVRAQEEARSLDHDYIGTEHLLLAMLNPGTGGIAAEALLAAGITPERARAEVLEIVGPGGSPPSGHIPFTSRAKKVLELSLREALEVGDEELGSEHILLGVIREGTGVGAQALVKLGVDLTHLRHQVIARRGLRGPEPPHAVARGAMSAHAVLRTMPGAGLGERPVPRCSFCGRREDRVPRLLVAGGMSLCAECARAAAAQLDQLPDDAPKRVRFRRQYAAPSDEPDAVAAIERAFDAIVGPMRLPFGEAFWAVEGGAELTAELRVMDRAAELAPVVINDVSIERVRFIDVDEAEVGLALWIAGNPAPMVQPVHAVRVDGTWQVSRATVQGLAAQARMVAPD